MKIIYKSRDEVVLPDLIATGLSQWALLDYSEFQTKELWTRIESFLKNINVVFLEYDFKLNLQTYPEEIVLYESGKLKPTFFDFKDLFEKELGEEGLSLELYLQSGLFVADNSQVIIFFEKYFECVLVGFSEYSSYEYFDRIVQPHNYTSFEDKINFLYNGPLVKTPNRKEVLNELIKNYFPSCKLYF